MPDQTSGIEAFARVYRPSGLWRATFLVLRFAFAVGGTVGALHLLVKPAEPAGPRIVLSGISAAFGFLGAYCFLYAIKSKVSLFADRISIEDILSTRVIFRHQIRGWRILRTTPTCLELQPSEGGGGKAKIALTFRLDDPFEQWFEHLPCLDAVEASNSEQEIAEDTRLGDNPELRVAALAHGRSVAKRLTIASAVIWSWAVFYPKPYSAVIVVLIVLPWVGIEILRRSNGLFRVDEKRNDAHPTVAYALLLPTSALALRSVLDFNFMVNVLAFVLYAAVGGLLVFCAVKFDRATFRANKAILGVFCAIGFAYGFGAVTEANSLLDRSPGRTYSARIEGKHISHGKHNSYDLELAPWGPKAKPNGLEVSRATYDSIACGDVAVLTVRAGAFGLKWYYLDSWQHGEDPTPCRP